MIDNMSTQQRMILAVALSFLFFVGYTAWMPQQTQPTTTETSNENKSPTTIKSTTDTAAPSTGSKFSTSSKSDVKAPKETTDTSSVIATINSKNFKIEIDDLGRVKQFTLKDKKHHTEDEGKLGDLFNPEIKLKPLEIRFSDAVINKLAFSTKYTSDKKDVKLKHKPQTITLTQNLGEITITKEITFHEDGSYRVKINGTKEYDYYISPGFRPDVNADGYTVHGVRLKRVDATTEDIEDGDATGKESFAGVTIIAASDRYYTTALYDLPKDKKGCNVPFFGVVSPYSFLCSFFGDDSVNKNELFKAGFRVSILKNKEDDPLAFIQGNGNLVLNGYIGPKDYDVLESINPELTDIIEYGFFTFLAKYVFLLLKWLYGMIGNWGWSIVAVTILIRFVLYPLTFKGMVSMNKLKDLSPKIKEIQAKHKGDPQKVNAKMMELYKKHNANPMGGCLPMIMQIPVFFAIYRVLQNAVELKSAEWAFWITDLSIKDPYFVLPILMGATMFWQQRITPTNFTDPMQEKIMKFLPLIFTFFFVTFPAGLTLYWFVNNLFSIAQQYYVNRIFAKQKANEIEEHKKVAKDD